MTSNRTFNEEPINLTLLRVIKELVEELHPEQLKSLNISLDSSLDRDLGLDSLARMELLTRLEEQFSSRLSEQLLATAETPRDLLRKLQVSAKREPQKHLKTPDTSSIKRNVDKIPHHAKTIIETLIFHVESNPDQPHIIFDQPTDDIDKLSYHELLTSARQFAAGLQHYGLQPGESVAIMLPTGADYFFSFLGILLAGGIPVPLYPPVRPTQIEEHLRRHRKILTNAQAKLLITMPEVKPFAKLLGAQVYCLDRVLGIKEISEHKVSFIDVPIQADDIAFLQYTSGSTGDPKGVVLTHANLLANIQAMGQTVEVTANDVFVSWLPLYHDMGLIGAWLGSLFYGCRLIIMAPLSFLARPDKWLWAIHRHGGTLSASPNFGYEICCKRIDNKALEGLNLSSWRMAFNGAEPVSPETLINFEKRFKPYGFSKTSLAPVYGLAESSVGLAFPPPGRPYIIDHIQRNTFLRSGHAIPVDPKEQGSLRFVACGRPLPGHQIRIVDNDDRELPERHEGRLQFKGPSATSGYFRNPEQSRVLFHDDWLDSGDLAYIGDGDVYLTSRIKDIIIRGGRNIYPHEIEEAVGNIDGIRNGCVAVFGCLDKRSSTERLVILAETRARKAETIARLRQKINNMSMDLLSMVPDEIVIARPGTVLKTSSGKIRRAASKQMYEQGNIGKPKRAVWLQIVRMALQSVVPQLHRLLRQSFAKLYALYCWILFVLISLPVGLIVATLPSNKGRWWLTHQGTRLLGLLSGTKTLVQGLENLANDASFILISNHTSYLDSLLLFATLPIQCSFVAKAELADNKIIKRLLSQLDVVFVNRFDFEKGIKDTKLIGRQVESGKILLFFCEGTLQRMAGLTPFQMGAFVTAAQNNIPVIPITICGTRNKMRPDSWFPRKGDVRVMISQPLRPEDNSWTAAIDLRDRARTEILRHCGEADLADLYTSITQSEAGRKDKEN